MTSDKDITKIKRVTFFLGPVYFGTSVDAQK